MSELRKRVYTAIPLILFAVFVTFYLDTLIFKVCAVLLFIALGDEWCYVNQVINKRVYGYLLLLVSSFGATLFCSVPLLLIMITMLNIFMAGLMRQIIQKPTLPQIGVNTALVFGGFNLVLAWYALVTLKKTPFFLAIGIATINLSDTFAYFFGKLLGKTYISYRLSPNKTWEGAIAGFILPVIVLILCSSFLNYSFSFFELLTLFATTFSAIMGDLYESFFKRKGTLKDSGRLLPGHGGLLDRLDSLIVAIPVFWAGLCFCGTLSF